MCYMFFFFKQKTAYEMRISDWSSDVCSSDLAGEWRVIAVDLRGRGESAYAKDAMTYTPLTYVQDIEALLEELGCDRFVAFGTSLGGIEIGRASCRERVCQYV